MALNKGGQRSAILLDWFTVTYRSIVFTVLALVAVGTVVGSGIYYKFFYLQSPRARAAEAISAAEDLLGQASAEASEGEVLELKQSAQRLLAQARRHFDAANYEDSTRSAEQSQMSSRRLLSLQRGETARAAQFYRIEGDVRVKRARELIWVPAKKGMALSVGDQIKTSSRAAAQIIYFNGTITTVTSGSLMEIKELYDNPSTRIQQVREQLRSGKIAAATQQPSAEGSFHEITTRNAVAVTEERSSLEVAFDEEEQRTRLEVHSGRAEVSAPDGGPAVSVKAREGLEVDREAKVSERIVLPPAPILESPIDQKIIPLGDESETSVELSWQAVDEAEGYHLQISSRALFSDLLVDGVLDTNVATLPRARHGHYYWRVAVVFPDGTEGPTSEVRKFRVVEGTLSPLGDDQPPPLQLDDFLVFSTQVIVRGRTEPGALLSVDGTRIDVYEDGTFTSVIPLRVAGRQRLVFLAQDVAGNSTTLTRHVEVDAY